MKTYFTIGEAAKVANVTSETLRHYDRIGLIKPSKIDDFTNYRYYTEQDIVLINTVRALQQMNLPLKKIKQVLEYDDLEKIIGFLTEAEKKADEKIALLEYSKKKIQLARAGYESHLSGRQHTDAITIKHFPQRVLMLSDTLEYPTLHNLWSYLSHFYNKLEPLQKGNFTFEDTAGIYMENGLSRLFAVCITYENLDGLKVLPAGNYLCAPCTEENRASKLMELTKIAADEYNAHPSFSVQQIVVSGILQWNYLAQVYIGK